MKRVAIALFIAGSAEVQAEDLWAFLPELPTTSELGVTVGADSANGWNRQLFASLEGPGASRVSANLARDKTVSEQASLQTSQWSIGISSNPLQKFSLGLSYEYWGKKNALTIHGIALPITLNLARISLVVTPVQRRLRPALESTSRQGKNALDVGSQGIGLEIIGDIDTDWFLSIAYRQYRYSEDPARLATDHRTQLVFSPETLQLASGLDHKQISMDISHSLSSGLVGVNGFQSTSAVDQTHTTTVTVYGNKDLSRSWRVDIAIGTQKAPFNSAPLLLGNFGIVYRW